MLFLSYSHHDTSTAEQLHTSLERAGCQVWRDRSHLDPGETIPAAVSQALGDSQAFCFIWSRGAADSTWVQTELWAAVDRRLRDPSYVVIPVCSDETPLPPLLGPILALRLSPDMDTLAGQICRALPSGTFLSPLAQVDWVALLQAIERDQLGPDPKDPFSEGGWSASYATEYLPLAFAGTIPSTVSRKDSITVTHWMVRGLTSLRRIALRDPELSRLAELVQQPLAAARTYLAHHFDGRGAGRIGVKHEGPGVNKDVRHTAAFVKATLELPGCDLEEVQNAMRWALSSQEDADDRVGTWAELLHLVGLLKARRELRWIGLDQQALREYTNILEQRLCSLVIDQGPSGGPLFGHTSQPHMSAYYSWWALDACGPYLLSSETPAVRQLTRQVLSELASLAMDAHGLGRGFPLSLDGGPDLGASAQIGEVLIRLDPLSHLAEADDLATFISSRCTSDFLASYRHAYLLWAIPCFFERHDGAARLSGVKNA